MESKMIKYSIVDLNFNYGCGIINRYGNGHEGYEGNGYGSGYVYGDGYGINGDGDGNNDLILWKAR